MRKCLVLLMASLLSGCLSIGESAYTGPKHLVEPEFKPLEDIRERPNVVRDLGSPTAITTIGRHCYVRDLSEWLGRKPPGSPEYLAVLRHEQEHAKRQLAYGLWSWLARYGVDREFALLEEQIGYYYQMTEERRLGLFVDPADYAARLAKYKIATGSLISFDEALIWAQDVLAGRWTSPN